MLIPQKRSDTITFKFGDKLPEELKSFLEEAIITNELMAMHYDPDNIVLTGLQLVLLPIRHQCSFLPPEDAYGELQRNHNYVLIDMSEKIDTGCYGTFRYIG